MTFSDEETRPTPSKAAALENWFTHHPPAGPAMVAVYQEIRNDGRELAELIADECPPGRERDIAIEKVREAVMWANASIACGSE